MRKSKRSSDRIGDEIRPNNRAKPDDLILYDKLPELSRPSVADDYETSAGAVFVAPDTSAQVRVGDTTSSEIGPLVLVHEAPTDGTFPERDPRQLADWAMRVLRARGIETGSPEFREAMTSRDQPLTYHAAWVLHGCSNAIGVLDSVTPELRNQVLKLFQAAFQAGGSHEMWTVEVRYRRKLIQRLGSDNGLREAQKSANKSRRAEADDEVLRQFTAWQRKVAVVLRTKDGEMTTAAERVKRFLTAKKGTDEINRTKITRLYRLLRENRIPAIE